MTRRIAFILELAFTFVFVTAADGQPPFAPATISVHSGTLTLRALMWRPAGRGPFPAVLLNHGNGGSQGDPSRLQEGARMVGQSFARHGYVFLYLFRRGVGPSASQGTSAGELMSNELAAHGQAARNALQMRLLEGGDMSDALSGLAFLRALPEVDPRKISVVGHSFGGSLTLLMAEREPDLRAVVVFSGASWDHSPELQERLLTAAGRIAAPVFFLHAANDYSLSPGKALDARREQLGKPHRLKIYPAVGSGPSKGHGFLYLGVSTWEPDVFAFLSECIQK
jgi:carboxymethylenebutenolidase